MDFIDKDFLVPEWKAHAARWLPLLTTDQADPQYIQANIAVVCPGFAADKNALVHIDEEERPLVRMMGHTNGRPSLNAHGMPSLDESLSSAQAHL